MDKIYTLPSVSGTQPDRRNREIVKKYDYRNKILLYSQICWFMYMQRYKNMLQ